jgi:hypothetical protein
MTKDKIVDKKETKKSEVDNDKVEKKSCNKNTEKANLKLDVNTRKKWLTSYYKRMGFTVNKKNENGDITEETPNISGAQYSLTGTEQVLCSTLLNLAFNKAKKTTAGLYNITEELLTNVIQLNPEFNSIYGNFLLNYKPKNNYLSLLEIKEFKEDKDDKEKTNEISIFAEKYACEGGNSKINLVDDGMNFLMFILNCNRMMLADCAYWLVRYSNKKQITNRAILYAVKNHYSNSKNLCASICKKLDEVSDLVDEANKAERESKKEDEKENKKSDKKLNKSDEKKSKKKSNKTDEKKNKKKSDSDASDNSSSDSDSGSESE